MGVTHLTTAEKEAYRDLALAARRVQALQRRKRQRLAAKKNKSTPDRLTVEFALLRMAQLRGDANGSRQALTRLRRLGVDVQFTGKLAPSDEQDVTYAG